MKYLIIVAVLFCTLSLKAEEDHHTEGFSLSAKAVSNFEIQVIELKKASSWEIPQSALMVSGEETNIYRQRGDLYQRIDFEVIKRNGNSLTVSSHDLQAGDKVVIAGVGFLRIAELMASGGAPEGHSH